MRPTRSTIANPTRPTAATSSRRAAASQRRVAAVAMALVGGAVLGAAGIGAGPASADTIVVADGAARSEIRPNYHLITAWPSKSVGVHVLSGEVFVKLPGASHS